MDAAQHEQPPQLATHYEVLGLDPSILSTQHATAALLKRAYHRALLRHHPDKAPQGGARAVPKSAYTVDQITAAFTTLSSPRQRAAYDASLRLSPREHSLPRFQTGVEHVDLDDLAFDDRRECWYRPCRCGNDRGYVFAEKDLEEVGDDGELMVGCQDCSLWLRVHFAILEDDDGLDPGQSGEEPSKK